MTDLLRAKKALEEIKQEWLAKPEVMGIDVGFKILESSGEVLKDVIAIRVHVEHKRTEAELKKEGIEILREEVNGVLLDVIQANLDSLRPIPEFPWLTMRTQKRDLMLGGISIGGENKSEFGTLGAMVFPVRDQTFSKTVWFHEPTTTLSG